MKERRVERVLHHLMATELGGLLLALLSVTCSLLVVKARVLCLYGCEAEFDRLVEQIPE